MPAEVVSSQSLSVLHIPGLSAFGSDDERPSTAGMLYGSRFDLGMKDLSSGARM
jgi:hypothetical protein